MARSLVTLFLRLCLAAGLLAAVAARFKLLGAPVGFDALTYWASRLWGIAPATWSGTLGWVVVAVEAILGAMLLLGLRTRLASLVVALLFSTTAVAMTLRAGIHTPFHSGVFLLAAASFALWQMGAGRFSVDGG